MFEIKLHNQDEELLRRIQRYFKGAGSIYVDTKYNVVSYRVCKVEELLKILIPLFESYPLLSQKHIDFTLFKMAVELIQKKVHLKYEESVFVKSSAYLQL